MPRIFDNIEQQLLPALKEMLGLSNHADFCVGYFNLRGWKQIDARIEEWSGGAGECCRLLVGMQRLPQDTLREALSLVKRADGIDNATAIHLKKKLAEEFREQLMVGVPTNEDEAGFVGLRSKSRPRKSLSSSSYATPCMPSYTCFSGLIRSVPSSVTWAAAI